MRKARVVTNPEDIKYLLELTEERCLEKSFITEAFGEYKGRPRFYPYDIVTIPPNSYGPEGKRNKNAFKTTVGLWVFNKAFVEKDLFDIFHYVNDTFGKKMAKKFKTKNILVKKTVKKLNNKNYSKVQKEMFRESLTFMCCKMMGMDVRTYCNSDLFERFIKSGASNISTYLNKSIKLFNALLVYFR